MRLEEGLDTGPVYDRVEVPIGSATTAAELRHTLVERGSEQLIRCLSGGLRAPVVQTGEPTYAAKLSADDFRLDWARPADELDRVVRVGGAWTTFRGKRLKVHAAELVDGVLVPTMVQPEGKAAMAWRDFRNGVRWTADDKLGS